MPIIDIDGEKKKVACGPCIRGHRSSKCQHSDRVLIEVRKPGRPLSACPHPPGSCGCQRAVYYTVPKNGSSPTPAGSLSPGPGLFAPTTSLPSSRVQKSKSRKNSTNVNTPSIQRAFEGDPSVLAQHVNQRNDMNTTAESSESSSNVPSLVSSSSSTPQIEAVDVGGQSSGPSMPIPTNDDTNNQAGRLQLGMFGIGGYGTASDELRWTGEWPDYNKTPPPNGRAVDAPARGSCCERSATPLAPKPAAIASSCCASKASQPPSLPQQSSSELQQFTPTMQDRPMEVPSNVDFSFLSHFSLPGPAFTLQSTSQNPFVEDQFGCMHHPDHTCQCGEGCECLGCSIHPANRTTTEYVRYHTELAMRGYVDPSRMQMPPPLSYGQQVPQIDSGNMSHPLQDIEYRLVNNAHLASLPHTGHQQYLPPWQGAQHRPSTPPFELSQFSLQRSTPLSTPPRAVQARPQPLQQPSNKQPESQARDSVRLVSFPESNSYDHESPSTEDDASMLSPSAFSVQQFNIPGCSDVTGSCLCGDGCQCEGCLTHNGHRNKAVPIDGSVETVESSLN